MGLAWLVVMVAAALRGIWLVHGYLGNASTFPQPLPPQEERAALAALKQGDAAARNRLIEHNLRLVAHIVKKFDGCGEDPEDLISIGTVGLIKGVETFNPLKGTRLATYAARCIENEILIATPCRKATRCAKPLWLWRLHVDERITAQADGPARRVGRAPGLLVPNIRPAQSVHSVAILALAHGRRDRQACSRSSTWRSMASRCIAIPSPRALIACMAASCNTQASLRLSAASWRAASATSRTAPISWRASAKRQAVSWRMVSIALRVSAKRASR